MKSLFAALSLLSLTSVAMAQEKQDETTIEVLGQSDAVVLKKTAAESAAQVKNVKVRVQVSDDPKDKSGKKDEKTTIQRRLYDDKLSGETIQNSSPYHIYQLPNFQYAPNLNKELELSVNYLNPASDASRIFIDIDLNNLSLKDALKNVFQKAKREFEILKDVDQDVRVTLKAKKIRLSTVLTALSDQSEVNWETTSEVLSDSKTMKTKYRFGKKLLKVLKIPDSKFNNSLNNRIYFFDQNNKRSDGASPSTKIYKLNSSPNKVESLDLQKDPSSDNTALDGHALLPGVPVLGTIFKNADDRFSNALTYSLSTQETRSTFTCPHCQKQLTIVSQKQSIKCPDCKRDFLSDWKFCPFDGAKRPASGIEWGFCPICGKNLPHKEVAEGAKK